MKTQAWDTLKLDRHRMYTIVGGAGAACAAATALISTPILGEFGLLLAVLVGVVAAYAVATIPHRDLERSSLLQAAEAPTLAASSSIYLTSTGSRSRTIIMLQSEEPRLSELFDELRRRTLLGMDVMESRDLLDGRVQSESIIKILQSVFQAHGDRLQDEGEELEGMMKTSTSSEETKFPVFLTISFFLPIMLMLVAAIGHHTDPISLVSLAFLEVLFLDIALSLSSTERKRMAL
jgi:hypothetical protein